MGSMAAEYVMEPERYKICVVSEEPHWAGKPSLILAERSTLEEAERALERITSETRIACGGGRTRPIGSAVVGILDGGRWI